MDRHPRGPFCQSCGMPLEKPEDFGTGDNGFRINDYCHHCFQNGAFTDPHISMEGMINRSIRIMATQGAMPENNAELLLSEIIPKLKRWR